MTRNEVGSLTAGLCALTCLGTSPASAGPAQQQEREDIAEVSVVDRTDLRGDWSLDLPARGDGMGPPTGDWTDDPSSDRYCCGGDDPCGWAHNSRCDCDGQFDWEIDGGDCEGLSGYCGMIGRWDDGGDWDDDFLGGGCATASSGGLWRGLFSLIRR